MIRGTKARPRLAVFRSNRYIGAQIIDDSQGVTLAAARGKAGVAEAKRVGQTLAAAALKSKIAQVVFDRRRYKFHGQVKAVADGAREGGLKF